MDHIFLFGLLSYLCDALFCLGVILGIEEIVHYLLGKKKAGKFVFWGLATILLKGFCGYMIFYQG